MDKYFLKLLNSLSLELLPWLLKTRSLNWRKMMSRYVGFFWVLIRDHCLVKFTFTWLGFKGWANFLLPYASSVLVSSVVHCDPTRAGVLNVGYTSPRGQGVQQFIESKNIFFIYLRVIHLIESRWPIEFDLNQRTWPKKLARMNVTMVNLTKNVINIIKTTNMNWWIWPKIENIINITTMTNMNGWIF